MDEPVTRGLTLIEFCILLVLIGFLAAFVYPLLARMAGVEVVPLRQPAPAPATVPALKCEGGFLMKQDGQVITKDGMAVRC